MPKKYTKADKFRDHFIVFKHLQANQIITAISRGCNKDGSIGTKSIFDVPDKSESEVLEECRKYLRENGLMDDRNNTGVGQLGSSGTYNYGIKNGGDIFTILPGGKHCEIECKRGKGGNWSKGQQQRCIGIQKAGGLYLLVHGVSELEYYLKDLI